MISNNWASYKIEKSFRTFWERSSNVPRTFWVVQSMVGLTCLCRAPSWLVSLIMSDGRHKTLCHSSDSVSRCVIFRSMTHQLYNHHEVKGSDLYTASERLQQSLQENQIQCEVLFHGFRVEFNGLAVFRLDTGSTRHTDNDFYWGTGERKIYEYAVLHTRNGQLVLSQYNGPAGTGWTADAYDILIRCFHTLME
jgi:hypothetical protein